MFIAEKKKQENIIEYILYIWYIQDIVRGFDLNMQKIQTHIIQKTTYNDLEKEQLELWYLNWINTLRKEGKIQKGNAGFIQEILMELSYLHQMLLFMTKDPVYIKLFEACQEDVAVLHKKNPNNKSDIEIILEALYGKIMLRLSQKEVSEQTAESLEKMSKNMAYLAQKYKQMKQKT